MALSAMNRVTQNVQESITTSDNVRVSQLVQESITASDNVRVTQLCVETIIGPPLGPPPASMLPLMGVV